MSSENDPAPVKEASKQVTPEDAVALDNKITIKRTRRVQLREAWVGWTQVIANILVPLTLVIAVVSLFQQSQQQQNAASHRQLERFHSNQLSEAQKTLFDLWSDQNLEVLKNRVSRDFIDEFVERAIESSSIPRHQINTAIVSLTSFFDRTEHCINTGLCAEESLNSQIGQYGRDFFCIYVGQIKTLRKQYLADKLGLGAAEFAGRQGGCS